MGTVRFHPWAARGFFLRGGYGLVQVKSPLNLPDGSGSTAKYRGMALRTGPDGCSARTAASHGGRTGPTT